jgi:hypothetical protein
VGPWKVFFPKNFCAKHLDGRAFEKASLPAFHNVKDVMEADIIAVENLSRLDERIERTVGIGDAKVGFLHFDMLAARILGKRVCEPAFFRQVYSRREAGASCNTTEIRKWAKGMSYKCRAACTHPYGPKLALKVSDSFSQRHTLYYSLLQHAVSIRGSRWKLHQPGTNQQSPKGFQVKNIEHLKDVDNLVDAVPSILDPNEKNKGPLERVVLTGNRCNV